MTDSLAISDILIVPGMYVVLTRTKEQRTPSYSHLPQKTLEQPLEGLKTKEAFFLWSIEPYMT
jgi:hypothetical protein